MRDLGAIQTLTVDEVASALAKSRSWVYGAIQDGTLPAVRVGRSLRIRRETVLAFLDANAVEVAPRGMDWIDLDAEVRRAERQVG